MFRSHKDTYTKDLTDLRASISWSGDEAADKATWDTRVADLVAYRANHGDNMASEAVAALSGAPAYNAAIGVYAWQMEQHGNHYKALRAAREVAGLLKPVRGPRSVQTNSVPTTDYAHKAWSWLTARKNRKH